MIDRDHIERILRLNGIEPTADDEEIKSILLSARYQNHEVDAALMVLREDVDSKHTKVDGLHKVFRSDEMLNSKEIAALLGVDVSIDEKVAARTHRNDIGTPKIILLSIIAALLAFSALGVYMYFTEMGVFHHTSAFAGSR